MAVDIFARRRSEISSERVSVPRQHIRLTSTRQRYSRAERRVTSAFIVATPQERRCVLIDPARRIGIFRLRADVLPSAAPITAFEIFH
jgi:hypothetical protein